MLLLSRRRERGHLGYHGGSLAWPCFDTRSSTRPLTPECSAGCRYGGWHANSRAKKEKKRSEQHTRPSPVVIPNCWIFFNATITPMHWRGSSAVSRYSRGSKLYIKNSIFKGALERKMKKKIAEPRSGNCAVVGAHSEYSALALTQNNGA